MVIEFKFNTIWRSDADNWSTAGDIISDSATLAVVAKALADGKILVVEHRHYRGSRAPDRIAVSDYDDFVVYLKENAVAGDAVYVFDITAAIEDHKQLVYGKCPDERGEVPKGGAY